MSTGCFVAESPFHDHNQRMVDKKQKGPTPAEKAAFRERFERMLRECDLDRASFEKAARLKDTQMVTNWLSRARVGMQSEAAVVRATGVSMDWLQRNVGEPFPNGPVRRGLQPRLVKPGSKELASQQLLANRYEKDIDALRNMLNALASAIAETQPQTGALASRALKAIQKEKYTDRGSYAEFLQVLDEAQDNSEAALQAARRRAASRSS